MELKLLEEIAFINPDSIKKDYPYDEIEYIDISSVGTGYLIETKPMLLSEASSRAKRLVKDGDTILSTVRPNRRSFLYVKAPKSNIVVSTGFAVLRAKDGVDPRYLYYSITDRKFTDYLTLSAKGAAYPAVDTEIIQRGNIPFHPLDIQKKISLILSAYDDLIENNLRRIQILEEMAQLIYQEWFVNFRFPGHEKAKFVNSELGKIPEGWEVKTLAQIATIKGGKKLAANKIYTKGKYPVFGGNGIQGYCNESMYEGFVIAFGRVGAYCGSIHWSYRGAWLNNNASSVIPYSNPELLLGHLLNFDFFNLRGGSAQPFISNSSLASIKLLFPTDEIRNNFCKIAGSLRLQVETLKNKNETLRCTRDLLLPKLISGELDVSDLDIVVREEKL